jgi:hypothetical protein
MKFRPGKIYRFIKPYVSYNFSNQKSRLDRYCIERDTYVTVFRCLPSVEKSLAEVEFYIPTSGVFFRLWTGDARKYVNEKILEAV